MDCIITVYKWLTDDYATPVAEILWTGEFHKSHSRFAKQHGGDFIEIQSLEEHKESVELHYV
jgi:hypothetical protein